MRLVVKKKKTFFWKKTKYEPSRFKLSDLLLGEPLSSAILPEKDILSYKGASENMVDGMVGVEAGVAGVTLGAKVIAKDKRSVGTLKREEVDVKKLLSDTNDRKVNMKHVLVKQLKKLRQPILAVLTERLVTTSTCTLSEYFSFEESLGLAVETGTPAKVKTSAKVRCDRDDSMVIPPGTVFAYKLVELDIEKDGFFELCLFGDGDIVCDAMPEDDDGLVPELENLRPLAELPRSTGSALFQRLCEVLKDRDALSDVENTLDEWCSGDAPVQTERDGSVSHSNSASAVLDLLSHMESEGPGTPTGTPGTPGSPLTAVHLLVSAMEALPDEALNLLSESSPDVLVAVNTLFPQLHMLDLKDQQKSCSSLHKEEESLPLPLQDDKAFHWVQQLLITCNVTLRTEAGRLWAETGSEPGALPLVLCFTVQGLSSLCDQPN